MALRVERALERLEGPLGRGSGAVLATFPDRATRRAELLEHLPPDERGPLHGVPFVAKGNLAVSGEMNHGMSLYSEWRAPDDANAILTLERLGAVLVGRTSFPELSLSGAEPEDDADYPRVLNPCDPSRTIGGSSSGSAAAVALGLVPLALGTDTGGSVRIPAAFSGVAGIKPTHDLFDGFGLLTVSWTLDQVGVLAEDLDLLRTVISATAALRSAPAEVAATGSRRVGVVRDVTAAFHRTHPAVERMISHAASRLESAGWSISEIPGADFVDCQPTLSGIINFEAARSHASAFQLRPNPFGPAASRRIRLGFEMGQAEYLRALKMKQEFTERLLETFSEVDIVLTPTVPFPAPYIGDLPRFDAGEHAVMTRLANLTGVPAVTVPGTWLPEGAPLGCQTMARHGEDLLAIEAAAVIAQAPIRETAT